MRILHLVSTLDVGGLERVVADLVERRHPSTETAVVCLEHSGQMAAPIEATGVRVEALGDDASRSRRVRRLTSILRRFRPDVVHTHNPAPHLVGVLASRAAGVPVVVHTKHGRNYPDRVARVWLNRQLARLTDAIVAVSGDVATVCCTVERVPRTKVRVIRNGVDTSRFDATPLAAPTRAVCVGRLHPIKDHETLLRAVRTVVTARADFHLDILGDGEWRTHLESRARELGVADHVTFHGTCGDVRPFLANAGLFVMSSLSEGVSLTLLEAMAAGLPVVATSVGGNPEVVCDGKTGLLVPARSDSALAAAMLRLAADPDRARQMGASGRARVRAHFDIRSCVAAYDELYRALLDRDHLTRQPQTLIRSLAEQS